MDFPSEDVASRVLQILECARRHPRRFAAEARRRRMSLDTLLATAITEGVRELVAVEAPGGLFVLTDIAGEHYWTASAFLRVADGPYPADDLQCFRSREEAEAEVRRQRRRGGHFRVARLPVASG